MSDILDRISAFYETYNKGYRRDPFKKVHWRVVADWLKRCSGPNDLVIHNVSDTGLGYSAFVRRLPGMREVVDFSGDAVAVMQRGEYECLAFAYTQGYWVELATMLRPFTDKGLWLFNVNQENPANRLILNGINAQFVSSRIAGVGSDIYGIHYAGPRHLRDVLPVNQRVQFAKYGLCNIAGINGHFDFSHEARYLSSHNLGFQVTDRGERYGGPDKTWRRIVIRKADDPPMRDLDGLMGLPVFKDLPSLARAVSFIVPPPQLDAIMMTRVKAGDGMIARHTDIALDKRGNRTRFGLSPDRTIRLHFVIQAAPECVFSVWNLAGEKETVNMRSGEVWYADIRKPHEVGNPGSVDRMHLVVDCYWSEALWGSLTAVC